jgi:nucleoside 2-deoxyribosyltransferase
MSKKRIYLGTGPKMGRQDVETLVHYLEDAETELFVPTRDVDGWGKLGGDNSEEKMRLRLEGLKSSEYYVGEFSYPSRQAFFEAGYAHALGKPIIAIHKSGVALSEEMESLCALVIKYEGPQDLQDKMRIGSKFGFFD